MEIRLRISINCPIRNKKKVKSWWNQPGGLALDFLFVEDKHTTIEASCYVINGPRTQIVTELDLYTTADIKKLITGNAK